MDKKSKRHITANLMYKLISSFTFIVIIVIGGYFGAKYVIPSDFDLDESPSIFISNTFASDSHIFETVKPTVTTKQSIIPTVTSTPKPSIMPEPTKTVKPTSTPKLSVMPTVTSTPKPSKTPKPTKTVKPTSTPKPSVTTTVTPTPKPSKTPEPTKTVKPTSTPKPSVTPAVTPTPKPSKTPKPTKTVKPTSTPKPSVTPTVTSTPKPSKTPEPTKTVTPTSTPKPSVTPTVTPTPRPSKTPEPTKTVTPTSTPKPSVTPTVTPTPKPSKTPEPTKTVTPTLTPKPSVTPTVTPTPKPSKTPEPMKTVTPTSTPKPSVMPTIIPTPEPSEEPITKFDDVEIHFITSGGDAVFITDGEHSVLIDTGKNRTDVYEYLTENEITELDCIILTNTETCHTGGLEKVLNGLYVNQIILPKIEEEYLTKALLRTLKKYGDIVNYVEFSDVGKKYSFVGGTFEILTPLYIYAADNLKSYSMAIKFEYYDTSIMFMSDITSENETLLLQSGKNLSADIIKISNHAQNGYTSDELIKSVDPKFAVIMPIVDENGSVFDEIQDTIELLDENKISYLSTQADSVIFVTNGTEITLKNVAGK